MLINSLQANKRLSSSLNQSSQSRVSIYDWLRFIATIFVVVGHSSYLNISTTFGGVNYILPETTNEIYFSSFLLRFIREASGWVYGFHMPLFFFLSGAVLGIKPIKNFDNFTKGKIKRLLFPYFIYGWLFMLPVKLLGRFYNKISVLSAACGLLSGEDSGHLWFLPSLFFCMVVFVLILKILKKLKCTSPYVILLITIFIQFNSQVITYDFLNIKKGLSYIFYFAIGYIFELKRNQINLSARKKFSIFCILTILQIIAQYNGIFGSFGLIVAGCVWTLLLAEFCAKYLHRVESTKIWKILVRNLFNIYLFHDPLEYIVLRIFMKSSLLEYEFGCYLYFFLRTVGVILVSICIGEIIRYIIRLYQKTKSCT